MQDKSEKSLKCFLFSIQVFCRSLNSNTYGVKYQLSGYKSAGLVKLAKLWYELIIPARLGNILTLIANIYLIKIYFYLACLLREKMIERIGELG